MITFLYSSVPFVVAFITWLVVRIFNHEKRLSMIQEDVKDIKRLELGKILSNHETRINELENDRKTTNDKLDEIAKLAHRIEGLLQSKRDKE